MANRFEKKEPNIEEKELSDLSDEKYIELQAKVDSLTSGYFDIRDYIESKDLRSPDVRNFEDTKEGWKEEWEEARRKWKEIRAQGRKKMEEEKKEAIDDFRKEDEETKQNLRKFWEHRIKIVNEEEKSIMGGDEKATSYDFDLVARYADSLALYAEELGLSEEESDKYEELGHEFRKAADYCEEEEMEEARANL